MGSMSDAVARHALCSVEIVRIRPEHLIDDTSHKSRTPAENISTLSEAIT